MTCHRRAGSHVNLILGTLLFIANYYSTGLDLIPNPAFEVELGPPTGTAHVNCLEEEIRGNNIEVGLESVPFWAEKDP